MQGNAACSEKLASFQRSPSGCIVVMEHSVASCTTVVVFCNKCPFWDTWEHRTKILHCQSVPQAGIDGLQNPTMHRKPGERFRTWPHARRVDSIWQDKVFAHSKAFEICILGKAGWMLKFVQMVYLRCTTPQILEESNGHLFGCVSGLPQFLRSKIAAVSMHTVTEACLVHSFWCGQNNATWYKEKLRSLVMVARCQYLSWPLLAHCRTNPGSFWPH